MRRRAPKGSAEEKPANVAVPQSSTHTARCKRRG